MTELNLSTATVKDMLLWRDAVVAEATEYFQKADIAAASASLRKLELATIDQKTLSMTDGFFGQIVSGRRVVATFDPARSPTADEIVIIYGNYPHMFANVVINNPIRRHIADFSEFRHDRVESDARWRGVDQILAINVDERLDRYDSLLRELALAHAPLDRLTRIPGVRTDPQDASHARGAIACLRSHIEALRRAWSGNFAHVLVLEDDFCFTSDLESHLSDLAAFFDRGYEYWICLIATSKYGPIVPKDDLVSITYQPCTNAAGYLVSRAGIEQLLPVFENALERLKTTGDTESYAADRCWASLQPSGRFFVFRRKLGFQGSSYSDIEGSISRYLD